MAAFARIAPSFFSGFLLGAHFLRGGSILMVFICLFLPALVFMKERWAKIAVQSYLVCGALVWVHTAVRLTGERTLTGQPWGRMAVILGTVAAFNILAAALLQGERMRRWFRLK